MNKTRIVVIGGGYAGVLAANHLRRRPIVDITLVNPRPEFVERIRLHQLVAGTDTPPLATPRCSAGRSRLVVDGAERIDAANRRVDAELR